MPFSRSDVERNAFASVQQIFERAYVSAGEIHDVHIIAYCRPVGSGIVCAAHCDWSSLAQSGANHERDEMSFRIVVLTGFAIGISASGIEVPQRDPVDIISIPVPMQGPLYKSLGLPIGINRILWMPLRKQ